MSRRKPERMLDGTIRCRITPGKDYIVVTGEHVKAMGSWLSMPKVDESAHSATNFSTGD